MKIHHTTLSDFGTCRICQQPILMLWQDAAQTTGQSQRAVEDRAGNSHYSCLNGKGLKQLNKEYKSLLK